MKIICKMNDFSKLMKTIDYRFKNLNLLKTAMTHSSFSLDAKKNNFERLEFLGDRVLGLIISEEIFKKFSKETEGELAKRFSFLVCKKTLIDIAANIKINNYVLVSSDVGKNSIKSIAANSLEALIAAIFLDSDFEITSKIVTKLWKKFLNKNSLPPTDPKSKLQEWCLKNKKKLPLYELMKKIGPDHEPIFKIKVVISDKIFTTAIGKNKQDAEIKAANKLLEKIGV
tara:strand:+ start:476 stop:1159 length:684 start_codon:yes stop_codon:yes gene_type:complete